MILLSSEYNNNTSIAYIKPEHRGELKIDDNTPLHEAIILCERHTKKLRLFRETVAIEVALNSQIISAIDPLYLKELKNPTTETITLSNLPYAEIGASLSTIAVLVYCCGGVVFVVLNSNLVVFEIL